MSTNRLECPCLCLLRGAVVACLKDGFNFIPTQTFYATFFYVKKVISDRCFGSQRISWSDLTDNGLRKVQLQIQVFIVDNLEINDK